MNLSQSRDPRWKWVVAMMTAVALVVPAVVWAGFGLDHDFKTNRKASFFRDDPIMTSSQTFELVTWDGPPTAQAPTISMRGRMTAIVSVEVAGGPVEIQARVEGRPGVLDPGAVQFDPGTGTSSFSFSFTGHAGKRGRCRSPQVEVRSPSGAEITISKIHYVLDYKYAPEDRRAPCPQ